MSNITKDVVEYREELSAMSLDEIISVFTNYFFNRKDTIDFALMGKYYLIQMEVDFRVAVSPELEKVFQDITDKRLVEGR